MNEITSLMEKTNHKNTTNYSRNYKYLQSVTASLALGGIIYA